MGSGANRSEPVIDLSADVVPPASRPCRRSWPGRRALLTVGAVVVFLVVSVLAGGGNYVATVPAIALPELAGADHPVLPRRRRARPARRGQPDPARAGRDGDARRPGGGGRRRSGLLVQQHRGHHPQRGAAGDRHGGDRHPGPGPRRGPGLEPGRPVLQGRDPGLLPQRVGVRPDRHRDRGGRPGVLRQERPPGRPTGRPAHDGRGDGADGPGRPAVRRPRQPRGQRARP
jgi:hypothetical protein